MCALCEACRMMAVGGCCDVLSVMRCCMEWCVEPVWSRTHAGCRGEGCRRCVLLCCGSCRHERWPWCEVAWTGSSGNALAAGVWLVSWCLRHTTAAATQCVCWRGVLLPHAARGTCRVFMCQCVDACVCTLRMPEAEGLNNCCCCCCCCCLCAALEHWRTCTRTSSLAPTPCFISFLGMLHWLRLRLGLCHAMCLSRGEPRASLCTLERSDGHSLLCACRG